MVPWVGLKCVIVVFPGHAHLLLKKTLLNKQIQKKIYPPSTFYGKKWITIKILLEAHVLIKAHHPVWTQNANFSNKFPKKVGL